MKIKIYPFILCLTLFSSVVYSQQNDLSFNVVNLGDVYSHSEIIDALEGADLCGFYYINEKRSLLFNDGARVELDSSSVNSDLPQNCFIEKSSAHKDEFWKISESGHLIRIKQTYGK